jgi:hypothetical protein
MSEQTEHETQPVYNMLWRNKWLTANAKSIVEMAENLHSAALELEEMAKDGIILDPEQDDISDDYANLITKDQVVAEKYGLTLDDFLDDDEYCDCEDCTGGTDDEDYEDDESDYLPDGPSS